MGAQFVDFVQQQASTGALVAPVLTPLIERVRELAPRAVKEIRQWTRDRALADRSDKWSGKYKTNLELCCGVALATLRGEIKVDEPSHRASQAAQ
ncbi:MAG: hypothetical protein WDN69_30140 [Aliidongia sp.]